MYCNLSRNNHFVKMIKTVKTRSFTRDIAEHGKCGGRCLKQTTSNENFGYGPLRVNTECPQRCTIQPCPFFDRHLPAWSGNAGMPDFLLTSYGGRCVNCFVRFGRGFSKSSLIAECPVCLESKAMTRLRCGHHVCWSCWKTICLQNFSQIASCPLCREPIRTAFFCRQ